MSRQPNPLFLIKGVWYARFYYQGERLRLSTATSDQTVAMSRLPIIVKTRMSWEKITETTETYDFNPEESVIKSINNRLISPPVPIPVTADQSRAFLFEMLKQGVGKYDEESGEWRISISGDAPDAPKTFLGGVKEIERLLTKKDQINDIANFYNVTMIEHYIDKVFAKRCSEIWLNFLKLKDIKSWVEITEQLLIDFRDWRRITPQPKNHQKTQKPPSAITLNRHISFLSKSFEIAVHRQLMQRNPIKFWKPEAEEETIKQGLSIPELKKVLADEVWQKDFLLNGQNKIYLGYKLFDLIAILFLSCKRRGEILSLNIPDIYMNRDYVYYKETKNTSKGKKYCIHKAFYLSKLLKIVFSRVINGRTDGPVFNCSDVLKRAGASSESGRLNGDYISELFKHCIERHAPGKNITLHCLRHTSTDIMEKAGLSDDEIDAALGHYNVKTAINNYKDRSTEAIAERVSKRTKKGIEMLSKACNVFIK